MMGSGYVGGGFCWISDFGERLPIFPGGYRLHNAMCSCTMCERVIRLFLISFFSPFGKDLEKEAKEDQAENDKMESRLTETDACPVLQNQLII
jgi:hypothetical protein